jgi:Fuc2NAc and GlcNAc transferase
VTLALGAGATALIAFLVALALIQYSAVLGLTDRPNARSLHTKSTPRAGGLGFAVAAPAVTALAVAARSGSVNAPIATLLAAAPSLALVGLADDRWNIPAAVRLIAQTAAAIIVVWVAGKSLPHVVEMAIAVVAIVAVTNIYNFMDGIDGLAASQAVIAASAIAIVAGRAGQIDVAIGMTILAAGAAGFLALNWPPARIFMGDVGSTFLGFSFGAWALVAMPGGSGGLTPLLWIVALFPFLFDGIYTLLRRMLLGEPFYRAHRSHLYQRLVQAGWTHRRTTLLYATLAAWSSMWMVLHYGYGIGSPLLAFVAAVAPVTLLPIFVRMSSEVSP